MNIFNKKDYQTHTEPKDDDNLTLEKLTQWMGSVRDVFVSPDVERALMEDLKKNTETFIDEGVKLGHPGFVGNYMGIPIHSSPYLPRGYALVNTSTVAIPQFDITWHDPNLYDLISKEYSEPEKKTEPEFIQCPYCGQSNEPVTLACEFCGGRLR